MKEQILVFELSDSGARSALTRALRPLRIKVTAVPPEAYTMTLRQICQSEAAGENPPDTVESGALGSPMLVFAGLSSSRLDTILRALRKHQLSIPHKAVLTPTNQDWTPRTLFEELEAERQAFATKNSG